MNAAAAIREDLLHLVARSAAESVPEPVRALAESLCEQYGDAVSAVLFYGSCNRDVQIAYGLVDLYLIVDSYRAAYGSGLKAFGNRLLPPNVFYRQIAYGNQIVRAKYAVLSLKNLEYCVSARCFQSYFWGRFTQPTRLVYARDTSTRQRIHKALAQAVRTFVDNVLPCVPARFDARELWSLGLACSYATELRAERSGRAAQLYDSAPEYFQQLSRAVLAESVYPVDIQEPYYVAEISVSRRRLTGFAWGLRRVQGKLLSILRLAKAAFTFDGGVDYLAWKIERHSGVKIEVTPGLRRRPLIGAWRLLWRLYRRGIVR